MAACGGVPPSGRLFGKCTRTTVWKSPPSSFLLAEDTRMRKYTHVRAHLHTHTWHAHLHTHTRPARLHTHTARTPARTRHARAHTTCFPRVWLPGFRRWHRVPRRSPTPWAPGAEGQPQQGFRFPPRVGSSSGSGQTAGPTDLSLQTQSAGRALTLGLWTPRHRLRCAAQDCGRGYRGDGQHSKLRPRRAGFLCYWATPPSPALRPALPGKPS